MDKTYTFIGYYQETDEIICIHVKGVNLSDAGYRFWMDEENGENRRRNCKLVSVFCGELSDQLSEITDKDGLLDYSAFYGGKPPKRDE